MYNPETGEFERHNRIRQGVMYSTKMLMDSIDHFYDILEVAKMDNPPEHAKPMLAAEYEQITRSYRYLQEHETKLRACGNPCQATLMFVEMAIEDYKEARADYEAFMKSGKEAVQ